MRRKLTEIISTMDQYNGVGQYTDEYEGGETVDIDTDMSDVPDKATITEEDAIKEMLNPKQKSEKLNEHKTYKAEYVLTFDRFINEYKGTPPNVQSYFGCLDDEDDLEEE